MSFPFGAETRRLDADGRVKIAWSNPKTLRLSDLLGWTDGSLEVVSVNGWMVLTQPDALAGVAPTRNGAHARFSIDASGVERLGLKGAPTSEHSTSKNIAPCSWHPCRRPRHWSS